MTIDFPWEVESGFLGPSQSFKFPTELGEAIGGHAPLEDGTLIAFLADPLGNARFMRMRPETDWAIEESRKGEWPPAIKAPMEKTWRTLVDIFAEANREIRALEVAASQPPASTEGSE